MVLCIKCLELYSVHGAFNPLKMLLANTLTVSHLIRCTDFLVRTDCYSEASFLSSTVSNYSKIDFLFAKLFSVKKCLLFTAKVSDSIDTRFISLIFFPYSQILIERVNYVERPLEQQTHMRRFDFPH